MATSISISKNGGKCEVALDGGPQYFEVNPIKVDLGFNTDTNYINVYFPIQDGIFAQAFPMASVTLGGVVISNKSVFDTQVAAVFPETNSGSGGSGAVSIQTDDTAAFASLTDGNGAFYEVAGEISYYAISSTGVKKKLTIPNF